MAISELRSFRPALNRFVNQFDDCIKTQPSREHLRTYLTGQLSPLKRKSIEPIALDANVPPRTLQEFLSLHRWDEKAVGRRLRELVRRDHFDENAIVVVDEVGFPKKGDKTAGVQKQYCGAIGKVDNCVVTVELGYVTKNFHAILDGDLFLPEETWGEDRQRCRQARIPDEVVYRPKWQIALDLVARSRAEGVPMAWLTGDEFYGRVREFREGVSGLGINYVVEVPASLTGWVKLPEVERAGTVTASGRTLKKPRLVTGEKEARRVSRLWNRGGPTWTQ